jgi:hypothetical protein
VFAASGISGNDYKPRKRRLVPQLSLGSDDVSALSEARFQEELRTSTMVRRAFDKAVRRKPPVVAADAGPMGIQLREGEVSRCAEAVRQSTTDDSGG